MGSEWPEDALLCFRCGFGVTPSDVTHTFPLHFWSSLAECKAKEGYRDQR